MNRPFDPHEYWLKQIQSVDFSQLPFWPPAADEPFSPIEVELDPAVAPLLHRLTKGAALLNLAAVIAATQVALARQSAATTVAVGTPPCPQEGRPAPSNLLPIVQSITADLCFRDLLTAVRRLLLDAFAIQDLPSRPVLDEISGPSASVRMAVSLAGFSGGLGDAPVLLIEALVEPTRVCLRMDSGHGFARSALRGFLECVARVLTGGVRNHTTRLGDIDPLLPADRQRIVKDWNATATAVPAGSVIDWIEREVARRPQALALAGERPMTYGELDRRANQLARRLLDGEVGREVRVGLYLDQPGDMVMAILATLKAGGAYVPLDPVYPSARIKRIIADADLRVIVTNFGLMGDLPTSDAAVLLLEAEDGADGPDPGSPARAIHPDQLAYLIYTSGSTGDPRGVLVTHRSLANAIHYFCDRGGIDERSRVSQICSFSFDASVLEIFLALTRGAALCIAPRNARASGPGLGNFLREQAVSVIGAVTPAVLALVELSDGFAVRVVNIGADKCPAALADRWGPGRLLLNCYGPTEATIDCVCAPCIAQVGAPPIGRPIANVRAYVLDSDMRPVPIATIGELYIGGLAVARGYHNRPQQTAERFVPDPFGDQSGARLYRTGDLARWRSTGMLDFCGRIDRQVKVDGLRIELGEIETELAMHPAVRDAVVEMKPDGSGQLRLVAYIVTNGAGPSTRELREHLSRALPAHMLPSAFVELECLPLNANGKLDRKALAPPSPERPEVSEESTRPQSEIERTLADIWMEILGIERIGRDENFFDLGGRSLHVTRVLSKVAKACQVELPLETMFNEPTLKGLAGAIAAALATRKDHSAPPSLIPVAARPSILPLSFSQQRLWFLHQVLPSETAAVYNGPIPAHLRGPLDREALADSFREIIRRHEVLRTAFRLVDGQPAQIILSELPFHIGWVDLRGLQRSQQLAETERIAEADARLPFDLEHPPLLRAQLIALGDQEHVFLINIHHIIFDGWSVGVLLGELSRLYAAFSRGDPSPLPELPLQYADFALWQRRWLDGPRLKKQLDYWRQQLADLPDLLLPTDAERPMHPTYRGGVESFQLSQELTRALKVLSRETDVTLFMMLLAGLNALFYRYTGQEDIVISSPVANRNHTEIEGLIGFFVNSLVLRSDLSEISTFRELLARVRRVTVEAYDHQDVPFEHLVEVLRPSRVTTHNPLFRAAFSLQNAPMPLSELPGIAVTSWPVHNRTAKFDFVLAMTDTADGLVGDVEYSSELFERDTIREIIEMYRNLLEHVTSDSNQPLLQIPLVAEAPRTTPIECIRETFTF